MIPRLLHRIWLNPPMPAEFVTYGRRWQELHPDWMLTEWDGWRDLKVPALLAGLWDAAPERDGTRWRADLLRLGILYRLGGLYVDTDVEPLRPVDELLGGRGCVVALSANLGPGNRPVVSNAVIAAEPGHPFLRAAIRQMPESVNRYRGARTAYVTGPWHLQRVLESRAWPDVAVLPSSSFYPQSNAARDRGEAPDLNAAYGWHRWATSRGAG